ncbi:hypothetical protein GCM10025298_14670 [Natronobiforma cellulositropha]
MLVVFAALVVTVGAGAAVGGPGVSVGSGAADTEHGDASTLEVFPSDRFDTTSANVQTAGEFDTTRFEIVVYEDGTATWTFRYERYLETASEEAEFRTFAEEFEAEETPLYERFVHQAQALTSTGYEHTDREMEAESFERSAGIDHRPSAMGVVEMQFTWNGFAHVDDDGRVTIGDVFDPGIIVMPGQTLTITAEDDLVFDRTDPSGHYGGDSLEESRTVSWSGDGDSVEIRSVVLLPPEIANADPGTNLETTDESDTPADRAGWLLAAFVALLAVGGVAYAGYRLSARSPTEPTVDDGERDEDPEPVGDSARLEVDLENLPPASESEHDPAASPLSVPDEELLTDDDRVVALIRRNGGRMKQVNIVEETGWSKSKVSMLLSEMEDDGTISKLRVGRENIISLEGFEPEAAKSPFDE